MRRSSAKEEVHLPSDGRLPFAGGCRPLWNEWRKIHGNARAVASVEPSRIGCDDGPGEPTAVLRKGIRRVQRSQLAENGNSRSEPTPHWNPDFECGCAFGLNSKTHTEIRIQKIVYCVDLILLSGPTNWRRAIRRQSSLPHHRRLRANRVSVASASAATISASQSSISVISVSFSTSRAKRCTMASGSATRWPSAIKPKCTLPL